MMENQAREALRLQIQVVDAASLLPHQRRDALLIVCPSVDILDVAEAIAADDTKVVASFLEKQDLYKPSLATLSDWCAEVSTRFQFVILQPYVLAQLILNPSDDTNISRN